MQEELLQFKLQEVWTLVDLPNRKRAIGTKWVFKNKKDKRGIMIKNKARLVAQGHTQEEWIEYDEFFVPVAIIEAIRLFLAYASFKDFVVYQMDIKSAFLYGKIEEEVYVCQPPGFEDPDFPDRVYKVEKALYGLHQAPKAWYETVSTYLLDNGFQRGKIDKTLFIRREKFDILTASKAEEGWDFYQSRQDEDGEEVYVHLYRLMIDSLMYLTSSRPDIMFIVCLWYPKDSPFDLVAYTDNDYARASLDRKFTTGDPKPRTYKNRLLTARSRQKSYADLKRRLTEFEVIERIGPVAYKLELPDKLRGIHNTFHVSNLKRYFVNDDVVIPLDEVQLDNKLHFVEEPVEIMDREVKTVNREVQLQALVDGKKIIVTEASVRWKFLSSTMASAIICLATNQKFNFSKYIFESMMKNLDNVGKFLMYPRRVRKGFSRRDTPLFPTMMVQAQQEQSEGSAMPTDPQHTPTVIQPSTSQPQLKQRSRRPKRKDTEVHQPSGPTDNVADEAVNEEMDDSLGRKIVDIDKDAEITLVHETQGRYGDEEMFDAWGGELFNKDPRLKGLVFIEEEQATTPTVSSQQPSQVKALDKGKWIMVEEPVKMKKKDQISLDEELAFKL
ncbi:putative ribonuclease H-like domain-containing protein [Tanacetum coccineum]